MKAGFIIAALIALAAMSIGCVVPLNIPNIDSTLEGASTMERAMLILYVADQARSKSFYKAVLDAEPLMDMPGMTEFPLAGNTTLGLMPEKGTKSFLGDKLPDAQSGNGIPRCELYLFVDDPHKSYQTLVDSGGLPISEPARKPWGDIVAYGADPDGHVIAFAKPAGE
jgi:predicted enzyme related to lactoylglutathione lyase